MSGAVSSARSGSTVTSDVVTSRAMSATFAPASGASWAGVPVPEAGTASAGTPVAEESHILGACPPKTRSPEASTAWRPPVGPVPRSRPCDRTGNRSSASLGSRAASGVFTSSTYE
ncbi:hypothetical protein QFZ49_003262 [Streptomyces turgidiscabies]|uniref:Uncharacterized protein n=1 Tax=Streptomyces turgidiscabies TaxID=85558 RepID=A0ABU0RMW1_9ACTN|nr:hypothetical protein [Streptomyces turgidiscabies]